MGWYKINENPITRSLYTYPDTPLHYVWDESKRVWISERKYQKQLLECICVTK